VYLLDANVFIEAKNRYYAFDIAPGFWEWLAQAVTEGKVQSVEAVHQEVLGRSDELVPWITANRSMFKNVDDPTVEVLRELSLWATREYSFAASREFIGSTADYFLVGYACAHGLTLVTHEKPSKGSMKKIKIPDACAEFDVPVISTFEMLRSEGVQLRY